MMIFTRVCSYLFNATLLTSKLKTLLGEKKTLTLVAGEHGSATKDRKTVELGAGQNLTHDR